MDLQVMMISLAAMGPWAPEREGEQTRGAYLVHQRNRKGKPTRSLSSQRCLGRRPSPPRGTAINMLHLCAGGVCACTCVTNSNSSSMRERKGREGTKKRKIQDGSTLTRSAAALGLGLGLEAWTRGRATCVPSRSMTSRHAAEQKHAEAEVGGRRGRICERHGSRLTCSLSLFFSSDEGRGWEAVGGVVRGRRGERSSAARSEERRRGEVGGGDVGGTERNGSGGWVGIFLSFSFHWHW
jgi:hypothetical protein